MNHELKIQPEFFQAIADRKKTFEVRRNDRNFKVNDVLILREFHDGAYTDRSLSAQIIYMTGYFQLPGYVVLGISLTLPAPVPASPIVPVDLIHTPHP